MQKKKQRLNLFHVFSQHACALHSPFILTAHPQGTFPCEIIVIPPEENQPPQSGATQPISQSPNCRRWCRCLIHYRSPSSLRQIAGLIQVVRVKERSNCTAPSDLARRASDCREDRTTPWSQSVITLCPCVLLVITLSLVFC